jgi:hypothetical protein
MFEKLSVEFSSLNRQHFGTHFDGTYDYFPIGTNANTLEKSEAYVNIILEFGVYENLIPYVFRSVA